MKYYVFFFLTLLAGPVLAQSQFEVEVQPSVSSDTLILDYYIQSTQGTPFNLGSSNIAVDVNEAALDLSQAFIDPQFSGPFTASAKPNSYLNMELGAFQRGWINLNIKKLTAGSGSGAQVPSTPTQIARVKVPISDVCAQDSVTWVLRPAAYTDFAGNRIKQNGTFKVSQAKLDLCDQPAEPVLTAQGSTTLCQGDQTVLTATASRGQIQWYKDGQAMGQSGDSLVVNQSGQYTAMASLCSSCHSSAAQSIQVQVNKAPVKPSIVYQNDSLYASTNADTYQWFLDGNPINGANQDVLGMSSTGTYTVKATNDCGTVTSDALSITSMDRAEHVFSFGAYPNPFHESSHLMYNLPKGGPVRIEIRNILTQEVRVLVDERQAAGSYTIPLQDEQIGASSGSYIATLRYDNNNHNITLVHSK